MADPTVGRIVHYQGENKYLREDGSWVFPGGCRAAIVTEVSAMDPTLVGLYVFHQGEDMGRTLSGGGVAEDQTTHADGTWHWPEGTAV